MSSKVDICNLALEHINAEPITSLSDNSRAARTCNRNYDIIAKATLRSHPWNCATRFKSLAASVTPVPLFKFTKFFPLPGDNLRVLETNQDPYNIPWKIGNNGIMTTDTDELLILYIADVSPAAYDSLLVDAMAFRLASNLAFPLAGDKELGGMMYQMYKERIREARSVDAREGRGDKLTINDWEEARFTGVEQGLDRFWNPISGT